MEFYPVYIYIYCARTLQSVCMVCDPRTVRPAGGQIRQVVQPQPIRRFPLPTTTTNLVPATTAASHVARATQVSAPSPTLANAHAEPSRVRNKVDEDEDPTPCSRR